MYPELLLYLAIGSCSNLIIARCSANKKIIIDLQKSNNAPYQNMEQELIWKLVEQDIVLPCNIRYYVCQYLWYIPGWITEWYLTREEEFFDETVQSAQEK